MDDKKLRSLTDIKWYYEGVPLFYPPTHLLTDGQQIQDQSLDIKVSNLSQEVQHQVENVNPHDMTSDFSDAHRTCFYQEKEYNYLQNEQMRDPNLNRPNGNHKSQQQQNCFTFQGYQANPSLYLTRKEYQVNQPPLNLEKADKSTQPALSSLRNHANDSANQYENELTFAPNVSIPPEFRHPPLRRICNFQPEPPL